MRRHTLVFSLISAFGTSGLATAQTPPLPVPPPAATGVTVEVAWRYSPSPSDFDRVVVGDGVLFALDRKGTVHAIDAVTGKRKWIGKEHLVCDRVFGLTLTEHERVAMVVVGTDQGMFAFRAADGEKLWFTAVAAGVAGPAVAKGIVVAGGADGRVYGFAVRTGEIMWQSDYLEDRPDDPPNFPGARARFEQPARPCGAVTDGKMVALSVFDQCRTLAFDAASGKRLWDFRTQGWMYGVPAIGPLFVYVGSQDESVYAVDKQLGKQQWKVEMGAGSEGSAALHDRFVYCGAGNGKLCAIDVAVGRVAWEFPIERFEGRPTAIYAGPVVLGDTVYMGALEGTVYAIDRMTGKQQWRLRPSEGSWLAGDLATDGQRLFVVTGPNDGKGESSVLAIRLP